MSDEILKKLEERAGAFEDFKKKNDEMLAAKASGKDVSALQDTIRQMSEHMTKLDSTIIELEKKAGRPKLGDDDTEAAEAHRKAFNLFAKKGDESGLIELHQKAMNSQSDPDGGFLVLPELDTMIERVVPTISTFAGLADNITIGIAKWQKMMKTSGMSMRRVADGANGGESTAPKYAKVEIEAFTAEVEPWVFNETLEDAMINLEADLADEAAIAFAEGLGAEVITGNGVGACRGITSYDKVANASYEWGKVGYIPTGKSAAFASVAPADALISLQHALKAQYRPGAYWLTNDTTLGIMRQMKDGSGSYYLWNPDPAAGFGGRFLGSPVSVDDNMAPVGAGSFSVAYGNWKRAYKIVNRRGTKLLRDPYTAKGQTKFNFTRRFGGGVVNFEAYKLLRFATS